MVSYRLYCMDGEGHIHFAEELEASNDEEAVRKAHDLKRHSLKCELWRGERLVATLDERDLAT